MVLLVSNAAAWTDFGKILLKLSVWMWKTTNKVESIPDFNLNNVRKTPKVCKIQSVFSTWLYQMVISLFSSSTEQP